MLARVPIYVCAADPISQAGLASQLRFEPGVRLIDEASIDDTTVAVVAADAVDEETLRLLRGLHQRGCIGSVLVLSSAEDSNLLSAIEAGVCALALRSEATPSRLADLAVKAASGGGALPPEMLGRLLKQVSRLQHHVLTPMGINVSGMSSREINVLKMVADGLDTSEIARQLCYSERTVKNVLHDVTSRFQLRNRSHAVAYAIREGLI
jgi:DNA-binding NarL/FixJ family response regulator